tara:strand:- start:63 stop:398 length:336 start_codon:yes stop_codon:yes gene_type:complete
MIWKRNNTFDENGPIFPGTFSLFHNPLSLISVMVKKKETIQFEEAFQRLGSIVTQLETGEESLEKSLELFEEGVKLAEACRAKLDQAEQAIKTLVKESEGQFSLEDFDESS